MQKVDEFNKMAAYFEIDHLVPLSEMVHVLILNKLARKKRRSIDGLVKKEIQSINSIWRASSKTLLNEPILRMVYFDDPHKQDFIIVNDFDDPNDKIMYSVQETFLMLHNGPGIDDLARTFGSLLLAEVDKRNLNPNKQMRVIEKLIQ
ncbi:hypothetical protein Tco_0890466 [Tanacetum coccineum]|uniref:Uncharacterized protein n=1 Tax=Tanacetum coccineum TaxID=301880 RepID=A0ABQ5C633_9ASTR